ncbi:hypothetical protein HYQ44_008312 [Verticillium longisporum]|nr:hypothetical protein HYQ44_008312 [Verticillium longisporum]
MNLLRRFVERSPTQFGSSTLKPSTLDSTWPSTRLAAMVQKQPWPREPTRCRVLAALSTAKSGFIYIDFY